MSNDVLRRFIFEVMIHASPEYMKKEITREHLQKHILDLVKSEQIQSDEDLESFFAALDLAIIALKNVPLIVWQQMSQK